MKIRSNHSPINQLIWLLSPFITCTYLSSCGLNSKSSGSDRIQRQTFSIDPPVEYHLSDPNCQQSNTRLALNSANIWHWEGLSVVNSPTQLSNTNSDQSLNSQIVSETMFGGHNRRTCYNPDITQGYCLDENRQISNYYIKEKAKPLKICRNDFNYPRESYEGIALTTIHYLNNSAINYQRIMGQLLPKVSLQIMPMFETLYLNTKDKHGKARNLSVWTTDNLSYSASSKSILVLPQQSSTSEKYNKFWESSFVLAHELGHHVESVHYKHVFRSMGLKWSPGFHRFIDMEAMRTGDDMLGFSRIASVFTSVSEAFADILAFYSERGDVHSLANLTCLGQNRNIRNAFFTDDTAKHLTSEVLHQLFEKKRSPGNSCDKVNFSDPHITGAVLAFVLYQIFEIAVPETDSTASIDGRMSLEVSDERYRRSVRWVGSYLQQLQKIRRSSSSELKGTQLFEPMVPAIAQAISGLNLSNSQKTQICEKATKLLPIFNEEQLSPVCR